MITLKNGQYFAPDGTFRLGDIVVESEQIAGVEAAECAEGGTVLDVEGLKVIPGLIDIHTHGAIEYDTMTASPAEIVKWSKFLAKNAVTSFLPTTITAPMEEIYSSLENVKTASQSEDLGASIEGAHIEGPYINAQHRGMHDPQYIVPPSVEETNRFFSILGDSLKIRVTIAPEMEGALDLIRYIVSRGGYVTIGHCGAGIEKCREALSCGANSFTHLFNGMRGIHHREPGTAGAGLLTDSFVELICDGIHLQPDIVNMVYRIKGIGGMVAITDAMLATGFKDGEYGFGSAKVTVKNGVARNEEGNLAGSTLLLRNGVRNIARFAGISLGTALLCGTINPARVIGLDSVTGSIEVGKRADLAVIDDEFNVRYTICKGKIVYDAFKD